MHLTNTVLCQLENGRSISLSKTQFKKIEGLHFFLVPILATLMTSVLSGTNKWRTEKLLEKTTYSGMLQD